MTAVSRWLSRATPPVEPLGQALGSGQRRDCCLKGDLRVAEGNALGTHGIKFPALNGVFNRESVMWLEVPRQGTWICGSTSGGAAPGYEDSGLQPARTSKFSNYRTDPFPVMGLIRVAGGDDLRVWFSEERVHHTHAPAATANKADGDAVARRWFARLAKRG